MCFQFPAEAVETFCCPEVSVTWHSGAVAAVGVPMSRRPPHSNKSAAVFFAGVDRDTVANSGPRGLVSMPTRGAPAMGESPGGGRIHDSCQRRGVASALECGGNNEARQGDGTEDTSQLTKDLSGSMRGHRYRSLPMIRRALVSVVGYRAELQDICNK